MTESSPNIYLLFGDNEFEISNRVKVLEESFCDPTMAAMNVTRLDGKTSDLNDIRINALSMPFLAARRVVTIENPLVRISTEAAITSFIKMLSEVPESTILILVEYQELTPEKVRRRGEFHWLEGWAEAEESRVKVERCINPKDLSSWIIDRIKAQGGKIDPSAARFLVAQIGTEPRQADQEIQKLLAYVNYRRTIELDDVRHITAKTADENIFVLVDALGAQNTKRALALFQRLYEQEEYRYIFSMVVRQFRLLCQVKEILDANGKAEDVRNVLKLHPYVAEKLIEQARKFTLEQLDEVIHQLLSLDEAEKTGEMGDRLCLELFILEFK